MKKRGVMFFVLRTLARQLQSQADFLFKLVGEEERFVPQTQPDAQNKMTTQQVTAEEWHLGTAEMEDSPAHWSELGETDGPPAHWLRRVQQATPELLSARVEVSRRRALPARSAAISPRMVGDRPSTPIPGMPAPPSPDQWYGGMQWFPPEAGPVEAIEMEAQLSYGESVLASASQPGEASSEVLASTTSDRTINSASSSPKMFVENNPIMSTHKESSTPAPHARLSSRRAPATLPRLWSKNTQMREYTLPSQEKWPDLPMRPDLASKETTPGADTLGAPQPAHHLSWPGVKMVIPIDRSLSSDRLGEGSRTEEGWPSLPDEHRSLSSDRLGEGSRTEEGWPSLPDEHPGISQDWRVARQSWERQQRLDNEQRGNVWNARLF